MYSKVRTPSAQQSTDLRALFGRKVETKRKKGGITVWTQLNIDSYFIHLFGLLSTSLLNYGKRDDNHGSGLIIMRHSVRRRRKKHEKNLDFLSEGVLYVSSH